MRDDSLMDRFERNARRFTARDAVATVLVAVVVLVAIDGRSMPDAARQISHQPERAVATGIAPGARWLSQRVPLHGQIDKLKRGLSPDAQLASAGGFSAAARAPSGVPVVTADAFAPGQLGARAPARRPLRRLLVTGDSLSTPLDLELARRLSPKGVHVDRDPHLGSGISKPDLIDWGRLATTQAARDKPDAVVLMIGANEGFPMPSGSREVDCCSADWAAIYANRARQMIATYRRGGATRVYWVTVPTPRDPRRAKIERVVNAAIDVAAQPWRADVTLLDSVAIFTPGERYRASMAIGGRPTLVRASDGIHLNERGSQLLADAVVRALAGAYSF